MHFYQTTITMCRRLVCIDVYRVPRLPSKHIWCSFNTNILIILNFTLYENYIYSEKYCIQADTERCSGKFMDSNFYCTLYIRRYTHYKKDKFFENITQPSLGTEIRNVAIFLFLGDIMNKSDSLWFLLKYLNEPFYRYAKACNFGDENCVLY